MYTNLYKMLDQKIIFSIVSVRLKVGNWRIANV